MSLMDMLQNAGSSITESLTPKKKPGELCIASCTINDIRCEACLAEQEKIRAALDELQNLEAAVENARNNPQTIEKLPTKCSLCGAPFEKGEQSCPYCGNKYPAEAVTADIPATEAEQDNLLLQKAAETYAMYANMKKRVSENKSDDLKGKLPGFLGGAVDMVSQNYSAFADMNAQQIRQLAKQNNVGYREYIIGVIYGTYQSYGDIKMQEAKQGMNELMAKMKAENERYAAEDARLRAERRQIDRDLRQKQQQSSMNSYKRQMEYLASKPAPQYSGGSGGDYHCCGNCVYYMTYNNSCGRDQYRTISGASDSCGFFKIK